MTLLILINCFSISTEVGVSGNRSAPHQTPILGMLKRSGGKRPGLFERSEFPGRPQRAFSIP